MLVVALVMRRRRAAAAVISATSATDGMFDAALSSCALALVSIRFGRGSGGLRAQRAARLRLRLRPRRCRRSGARIRTDVLTNSRCHLRAVALEKHIVHGRISIRRASEQAAALSLLRGRVRGRVGRRGAIAAVEAHGDGCAMFEHDGVVELTSVRAE